MHSLQVLAKEVFAVEEGFAVGAGREVAAPVPELQVDVVDVSLPFVFAAKELAAAGEGEEALEGARGGGGRVAVGGGGGVVGAAQGG